MEIGDFLSPDRIFLEFRVRDKPHLIREIARLAGADAGSPESIEAALFNRESLGSTGIGAGFALPHARIQGLASNRGYLFRLARPVDFDAIDGKPVSLVFALLTPEAESSNVGPLAAISRKFRDP